MYSTESNTGNRSSIIVDSNRLKFVVVNEFSDTAMTSNPRFDVRATEGEPNSLAFDRLLRGPAIIRKNIQCKGFPSKRRINLVAKKINFLMNFVFELVHTILQSIHTSMKWVGIR